MNKPGRRNQLLALLLLLQTVLAGIIYSQPDKRLSPLSSQKQQLLPPLALEDLQQVAITDERGQTVIMQKEAGQWVLPALQNYPVKAEQFKKLLGNIITLSSNYLVTTNSSQQMAMEVSPDKFRRRIQLDDQQNSYTVFLGNSQNSSYCHVRVADSEKIWGVENITEWQYPAAVMEWADTLYFSLPAEQLTYLSLDGNSLNMTLERTAGEAWHWPGPQLADRMPPDQEQIAQLANELSALEFSSVAGSFAQPELAAIISNSHTITVTLRADQGYQLYILPQKDDTSLLYKQGASHVVKIDNWQLTTFYGVINDYQNSGTPGSAD